jgi:hypothetical protein
MRGNDSYEGHDSRGGCDSCGGRDSYEGCDDESARRLGVSLVGIFPGRDRSDVRVSAGTAWQ